jgi:hypothetical protein
MAYPDDPLSMDVRRDLERVDDVMTQVIRDPATTEEFIRDPSGVLTRLGLHPRTTREIHDRVNEIFYAVLTNRELIGFVLEHFESFEGPVAENAETYNAALGRGEIEHTMELDIAAADHFFRQPDVCRRMYQLTLYDLNNRGLLKSTYTPEQLDSYIDDMVAGIQERKPIRELPELERWDMHYGVGTGYGVGEAEVGPAVTAVAVAEVAVPATVVIPVGVLGLAAEQENVNRALRGDASAVRMLATASALLRLGGELLVHANNFTR